MPRGVPNAKKDETGLRYTTFNVPLSLVLAYRLLAYILTFWEARTQNMSTQPI